MKSSQRLTLFTAVGIVVLLIAGLVYLQFAQQDTGVGDLDLQDQPALGNENAPVELVIFEDFACPGCAFFAENVFPRLKREYIESGRARAYFVNLQFLGPGSVNAGIAGECAYRQDEAAFWDYKTYIYRMQGDDFQEWATPAQLAELAGYVPELDADELERCVLERRYEAEVARDRRIAERAGVQSTPTVLVNGKAVPSPSYEAISTAIEEASR